MHKIVTKSKVYAFIACLCFALVLVMIVPIQQNRNYVTTINEVSTTPQVSPTPIQTLSPTQIPASQADITFSNGTQHLFRSFTQTVSPTITFSGSQFHSSMYSQFLIYSGIQEVAHDISDTLKPDNLDYVVLFLAVLSMPALLVFILRHPNNGNIKTQKKFSFQRQLC